MKLLKFSATWCGPCKVLDKNLEGFDMCPIEKIDIEEEADLVEKHKIMSVPTLILVDADGNQVWRHTGTLTADELRLLLTPYFGDAPCT